MLTNIAIVVRLFTCVTMVTDVAATPELSTPAVTTVSFQPAHYTVMENIGKFTVSVKREGGDLNNIVYVDYKTEDGTANAGTDYSFAQGISVSCLFITCWLSAYELNPFNVYEISYKHLLNIKVVKGEILVHLLNEL